MGLTISMFTARIQAMSLMVRRSSSHGNISAIAEDVIHFFNLSKTVKVYDNATFKYLKQRIALASPPKFLERPLYSLLYVRATILVKVNQKAYPLPWEGVLL